MTTFGNIFSNKYVQGGINLLQGFMGMQQKQAGFELEALGYESNAGIYRTAGVTSVNTANYNIMVDKVNTSRKLDAMSRQITGTFSTNRATTGASGIGFASRSVLAVANQNLTDYERAVTQERNAATQRQQSIYYDGVNAKIASENQARAQDYQAAIARANAEASSGGDMFGMAISAASLFM
jgi:hypothetical protein